MNPQTWGGASFIVFATACARYEHRPSIEHAVTAPVPVGSARQGMLVYRDPVTGQFIDAPATTARTQAASAPSAPAPALAEVSSPGGGTMVRLHDSFQNFVTAEVGPDGSVTTRCDVGTR